MNKINLIGVSILLSFNIQASETDQDKSKILNEIMGIFNESSNDNLNPKESSDSLNTNDKKRDAKIRSYYRDQKQLFELEDKFLKEELNVLDKKLEKRKKKYLLSIPIEKTLDKSEFFFDEDVSSNDIKIPNKDLNELRDQSLNFSDFNPSSYAIDQIIVKEREEVKKVEEVEEVEENNEIHLDDGKLEVVDLKEEEKKVNKLIEDKPKDKEIQTHGISDEILKDLGMTSEDLENISNKYNIEDSNSIYSPYKTEESLIVNPSKAKKPVKVSFADIKKIKIKEVIIFRDRKSATISVDIYVGDGINGKIETKEINSVKEGHIIKYKGYTFEITSITNSEIEIKNLDNDKFYISSN